MKVAPLHRALQAHADTLRHLIVHTGQHYDDAMSKVFFEGLDLPRPDAYLGVGSGTHAEQTARIMVEFERVVPAMKPDVVVVVGDVNSTLACSLVSVKLGIPVAHIEAGLRSFDRTMPEEINRRVTDAVADFLFVSEPSGLANLRREGVDERRIFHVGNIMIDSLLAYRERARCSAILTNLNVDPKAFTLVTLHRPSNVDTREGLDAILKIFERLAERTTIVFPVHPRTKKMMEHFGMMQRAAAIKRLKLTEPLGYLDFLNLMENAQFVLTDSGGIQEETTFLGIPCLTMRENTERPITIEIGTNILCGSNVETVVQKSFDILDSRPKQGRVPELWDGRTAERIATLLRQRL